ncbi:hypothetical protein PsorP6_018842 [Peronosclerospora sorghi]|nr:hypothetical protein PsorP6_018842 [Peronosclerospora sorghi]
MDLAHHVVGGEPACVQESHDFELGIRGVEHLSQLSLADEAADESRHLDRVQIQATCHQGKETSENQGSHENKGSSSHAFVQTHTQALARVCVFASSISKEEMGVDR